MSVSFVAVDGSGRLWTTTLHFLLFRSDNSSATLIATDDGVKVAGNSHAGGWVEIERTLIRCLLCYQVLYYLRRGNLCS